jgi:hypothetical protein
MKMKTTVHHWSFETGIPIPEKIKSLIQMDTMPRGWYCWVYPEDDHKFEEWMGRMCPTADVTHRFNSGDPMYTVFISDENEATTFQLAWM